MLGVFITMEDPTQLLLSEAASAGLYHSDGWNRDYPRLQIISVGDLLAGRKMVEMPPLGQVSVTYKKAPKAKTEPGAHAPELPGLG